MSASPDRGPGAYTAAILVLTLLAGLVCFFGPDKTATKSPAVQNGDAWFVEIGQVAGVDRPTLCGGERKFSYLDVIGTGVALFDADGDGRLDIYAVNGGRVDVELDDLPPLEHVPSMSSGLVLVLHAESRVRRFDTFPNALYRSRGDGTFEEIAATAGVADGKWGMGAAVGDYDADGHPDLYVTNIGPNALYRNRGDGTFEETGKALGLNDKLWSTAAAFADIDRDGNLDLSWTNYMNLEPSQVAELYRAFCHWKGLLVGCPCDGYRPVSTFVKLRERNGGFRTIGPAEGLSVPDRDFSFPLGLLIHDLDGDGKDDLYLAGDVRRNLAYLQVPGGFREAATPLGLAVNGLGKPESSMGMDLGDVDGNGDAEIFVTNYAEETNTLYARREGMWLDRTAAAGLDDEKSYYGVGWGTKFLDFDNDGDLDLLVVQGHLWPQLREANLSADERERFRYEQADLLYRNEGNGTFVEVGERMGLGAFEPASSRGLATGDLDDDGDLDWVETVMDGRPRVWINRKGNRNSWLTVRLVGKGGNTEGIGGVVRVTAGGRTQVRWVSRAGSFLSSSDVRAHFGLGEIEEVSVLDIQWPTGRVTRLERLPARRHYIVKESDGSYSTLPPSGSWR